MRVRVLPVLVLLLAALSLHAQGPSDPAYGLSTDFRNWLTANGYGGNHFERSDVGGGSYGGRTVAGSVFTEMLREEMQRTLEHAERYGWGV